MIEIRRLQNVKVGTLLYAFPPDAAARIAELEAYGRTRADEMLAATVRIAELEKQRDTLLAALERVLPQYEALLRDCDLTSKSTIEQARDAIASVKEQA